MVAFDLIEPLYIDGGDVQGDVDAEYSRLEQGLIAVVDRIASKVTNGDYDRARSTSARGFTYQVATVIRDKIHTINDIVDEDIGVLVIHNQNGIVPELERIPARLQNTSDLELYIGLSALRSMLLRGHWSETPKTIEDESGCEQTENAIVLGARHLLGSWTVMLGEHSPYRFWLEPLEILKGYDEPVADAKTRLTVKAARKAFLAVTHTVLVDGVAAGFGRIDGKWVLLVIDAIDDHCG